MLVEVTINVKDDDAIATDTGKDTNSLEVRVAFDCEGYISRIKLGVVAGLKRVLTSRWFARDHWGIFGIYRCVDQARRQLGNKFLKVHVL